MEKVTSHLKVGREGEQIAEEYLRSLGYCIYDRNVRISRDEIDLIAFDPNEKVMIFAEVKSRARFDPDFHPELGLTPSKKEKLHRAASAWVVSHEYEGSYRVDAVCVVGRKVVEHIKELTTE